MNENKKPEKKKSARTWSIKKAKKLMQDYRIFGEPHIGQASMLNNSGITAPIYNLTASAISWN